MAENYKQKNKDDLATMACDIQNEISLLKAKQNKIKSELFKRLISEGKTEKGDGIESPSGAYVWSPTVKYEYPADVETKKEELARAQERAKNEGRVKRVESPNYRFKEINL